MEKQCEIWHDAKEVRLVVCRSYVVWGEWYSNISYAKNVGYFSSITRRKDKTRLKCVNFENFLHRCFSEEKRHRLVNHVWLCSPTKPMKEFLPWCMLGYHAAENAGPLRCGVLMRGYNSPVTMYCCWLAVDCEVPAGWMIVVPLLCVTRNCFPSGRGSAVPPTKTFFSDMSLGLGWDDRLDTVVDCRRDVFILKKITRGLWVRPCLFIIKCILLLNKTFLTLEKTLTVKCSERIMYFSPDASWVNGNLAFSVKINLCRRSHTS